MTYRFDDDIHNAFVAFSQDSNPIHTDPLTARKTLSGKRVVHGMHTLLAAMENWTSLCSEVPTRIKCDFSTPVSVGDNIEFITTQPACGQWKIRAMVDSTACATIIISTETRTASPEDRSADDQSISLDTFATPAMFPQVTARVGEPVVKALGACSYLVGMQYPGLYSIFSQLDVAITQDLSMPAPDMQDSLDWHLLEEDERFGLVTLSITGPVTGHIRAFRRPEPVKTPGIAEVAQYVAPDEFSALRALVVGGSRGIGACTAKILATGGGQVTLTYCLSQDAAMAVCQDINDFAASSCHAMLLDACSLPAASPPWLAGINAVFYFASPQITRSLTAAPAGNYYTELYVDGLAQLCALLEAQASDRVSVFLPSSVFLQQQTRGFDDYIAAKSAAEALAEQINSRNQHVSIHSYRLPAMATDQTVTPGARQPPAVLETVLPFIRDFSGTSTKGSN